MNRGRLALAIPTFQRSAIVAANLGQIIDEAVRLGVKIYISDDSPDRETELVANDFAMRFDNVSYRRNSPAHRHDKNLFSTLTWPEDDYVWLLGDALRPKPGQLEKILHFLEDQDLVFINSHSEKTQIIPRLMGQEARDLVRNELWHQTLTGATIYHRRVINWAQDGNLELKRNFPHLSLIMGYASNHPISVGWFGEPSLQATKKQSYWRETALNVFVDDWVSVVTAYPKIVPPGQRRAVLKSHSAKTNLFDLNFLRQLKQAGHFNFASTKRSGFWDVMHLNRLMIFFILLMPSPVIELLLTARRSFRRNNKNLLSP